MFLHPTQRSVAERCFSGPARVAGSAGTGKTVVAPHRAARPAASPDSRVLPATFSQPPASALQRRLAVLAGAASVPARRVTVAPFRAVADGMFQLACGRRATPASDEQVRDAVQKASETVADTGCPLRFPLSEWRHMVDA